jgi:hypothetical protein
VIIVMTAPAARRNVPRSTVGCPLLLFGAKVKRHMGHTTMTIFRNIILAIVALAIGDVVIALTTVDANAKDITTFNRPC